MWYGHHASRHQHLLLNDASLADHLVERLVDVSLDLQNKPGLYTHYPRNSSSPSVVDLTFTRGRLSSDILDWTLGEDFGSDHLRTHIRVSSPVQTATPKLAWSKANWEDFATALDREGLDFRSLGSPGDIERATENYARALHNAIDHSVPKVRPGRGGKMRGWWHTKLDEMSKTVRCLQTEAQRNPSDKERANSARIARNSRRNAIRAARQSCVMLKLQETGPQEVSKVLRDPKPAPFKAIAGRIGLLRGQVPSTPHSPLSLSDCWLRYPHS